MTLDVAGDEAALGGDRHSSVADVVQGRLRQLAAEALSFERSVDDRVREDDVLRNIDAVLGETRRGTIEGDLVALGLGMVRSRVPCSFAPPTTCRPGL